MDEIDKIVDAFARQNELRDSWQAKLLRQARANRHYDKTAMVLISVLASSYDEMMLPLLRTIGLIEPPLPCLVTSGKIAKSGAIIATVMFEWGKENRVLYADEIDLRDDFRRLADRAMIHGSDRLEMFLAIRHWIVADYRLDPTMDPSDPDARRLLH
jgi:hypothetical protein